MVGKGSMTISRSFQLQLLGFVGLCFNKNLRRKIDEIPKSFIPLCTLVLLFSDVLSKKNKLVRNLLVFMLRFGSLPSFIEALEDGLFSGEADLPALVAIQLGLVLKHERAVSVILLMLTGGEAFEEYALNRAQQSLHSLLKTNTGVAHVKSDKEDGILIDLPSEEIKVSQQVFVKHGEMVPVDGVLVIEANDEQLYSVDESLLTGEQLPVKKKNKSKVLSGSRNKGPAFWMKASKTYSSSVITLMKAKLKEALDKKANMEIESKKFVSWFTPITICFALLSTVISKLKKKTLKQTLDSILSVFMSATPCPAGIGVPIAMLSGMSVGSKKYGGTFKSGTSLEALSKCNIVVLDKTGTITNGSPSLSSIYIHQNKKEEEAFIVQKLASLEQFSTHPLAAAICNYFNERYRGRYQALGVSKVLTEEGTGISGVVGDNEKVWIGSKQFCLKSMNGGGPSSTLLFGDDECSIRENDDEIEAYFVIRRNEFTVQSGRITFVDQIRPTARKLVEKLQNELKMRVIILSGDKSGHLAKIASQLGITEYYSCLPHEKAAKINELRAGNNTVLMVGDGGNDSAALACADVGMSIGSSNLASESASIVLMNSDLTNIYKLIKMSQRVVRIAKRTVFMGMSASLIQMFIAAIGSSTPFISSVVQECIDLGAVIHSLSALSS